jgi:tRNA nucleotidyltransferase/poly(A) polymerase
MSEQILEALSPPAELLDASRRLRDAGCQAWLVGEALPSLLRGDIPVSFELATSASPERILELFPAAVPTQPDSGIVTIPTSDGPIDAAGFRNGPDAADDLGHRDFTFNAMAYDPVDCRLLDPFSGCKDLREGLLRCPGSAAARLAEDPLRALRAARLAGTYELRLDPTLERAIQQRAASLLEVDAGRCRRELSRLLLAPGAHAALTLMRHTGLQEALAPGVRDDAGALVESMPRRLTVRLAAWLRGTEAAPLLRRLRFGLPRSRSVLHILEHHPLDTSVDAANDSSVRRLLRGLSDEDMTAVFQMREWELAHMATAGNPGEATSTEAHAGATPAAIVTAQAGLDALRRAIGRVRGNDERRRRRQDLALDGREVMQALGCGPGRRVGLGLAYLVDRVARDPGCNSPEALRALLAEWSKTPTT